MPTDIMVKVLFFSFLSGLNLLVSMPGLMIIFFGGDVEVLLGGGHHSVDESQEHLFLKIYMGWSISILGVSIKTLIYLFTLGLLWSYLLLCSL